MKTKLLVFFLLAVSTKFFGQTGLAEHIVTGISYTTNTPELVKAADLDGDGDVDVVTFGRGLNWYENVDGEGSFGEKKVILGSTGTIGGALHTVDFDHDGDIDILGSLNNVLTIYKNDGIGNFSIMVTYTLGLSTTIRPFPEDMDADGDMDIVCFYTTSAPAFQGKIVWFANTGAGTFAPEQIINNNSSDLIGTSLTQAADLDGDGDKDIIIGYPNYSKIAWLKNTGNNIFNPPVTITTSAPGLSSITTSDLDGDGDKDIISTIATDNQVAWYKNVDGLGVFTDENILVSNATASNTVLITDINNDNTNDIIYTGTNEIGLMSNTGGAVFGSQQLITNKAYGVRSIILADIDGDGKQDLVSASQSDEKVAWYKSLDGNGSFGRQVVIARLSESVNNVYPGDFDGDNDIDLLVNSQNDAKLTWFENVNGLGFYGKEHVITEEVDVSNFTPIAYPSDLDGDGDMDIAVRKDAVLFWYENDGQGNFIIQHTINASSTATIIRSADFDGDGNMDLVCGVYNSNKISWYKNLGGGTFGTEHIIEPSNGNDGSLTSLEIADMDGDGDKDIIASSYTYFTNYYKNTNGLGTFVNQNELELERMYSIYPGDMDGDGDKDIIGVATLGGGGFDAVVWYENNGLGHFTATHAISTANIHGRSIHAADIDNDGDIDVITGGGTTTEAQYVWYSNNGNGTFAAGRVILNLLNLTEGRCVNTADVDNDGDNDILTVINYNGNSTMGKVSVFENLGLLGNTIQGKVLIDSDSNGCTSADLKGSNLLVISDNGTHSFSTFTDQNGYYHVATTAGNFTTAITSQLPDYFVSNPASYTFNFSGLNNTAQGDFCVAPVGLVNDLDISIYPLNIPRPGFSARYRVVYRNKGTTTSGGTINFEYNNNKISFLTASQAVSSQTINTLTFDFINLHVFETRTIDVNFTVFSPPVTNINDHVITNVTINPVLADETVADNNFTLYQTVVGSYDPNDITCLEGNQVPIEDADKFLHYIIRFQNTGTAKAINVRVENALDSKLDWTSMQLESLSHNGRVEINDGSEVKFIFNNINLPDSITDESHSHGFIAYKIKPLDNVVVGDVINDTADIYFDFNPPIITNTASTQFVDLLSVSESNADKFSIYPNPTNSLLNIQGNTIIDKVSLIDINGRILKEFHFNTPTLAAQLELTDLITGIYFLKIKSDQGDTTRKIIKK
jgi:hypothetical protein